MLIAQLTDQGVDKFVNEDSIFTCTWEFSCGGGIEAYNLLIVADGIGGAVGGEIASNEAIMVIVETLARSLASCYREPRKKRLGPDPGYVLRSAVEFANARLFRITEANQSFRGMGTTMVAALFHGGFVYVAHVGDCRLYRLRSGFLERLTKDQSLVQLMLDEGKITDEEAFRHEMDNVILQGVGIRDTVFVEIHQHDTNVGDVFFLASDGAVSDVPVQNLVGLCRAIPETPAYDDLKSFCTGLADAATDPSIGATLDNLSIVAVYIDNTTPCIETHGYHVCLYGEQLPVDRETLRCFGKTLPYGVDSPCYRLYGADAPSYALEMRRSAAEEV